jgi:hypothetical protein
MAMRGKPAVISTSSYVSYIGVESDAAIPDGTTVARVEAQDALGGHIADFDFDPTPAVFAKMATCITITLFGLTSGILLKKKKGKGKKLAKITISPILDPGQVVITLTFPDGTNGSITAPVDYVSAP